MLVRSVGATQKRMTKESATAKFRINILVTDFMLGRETKTQITIPLPIVPTINIVA